MRKATLILGAAVIVAIVSAFILQMMFGRPRTVRVSITFLRFTTNSANGTRLAMFAVSNLSGSAITQIAPFIVVKRTNGVEGLPGGSFGFHVQIPSSAPGSKGGWTTTPTKGFQSPYLELPGAGSGVLGFIAPTNQPVWGLYYRFLPDVGVPAQIKRVTVGALWQIGLRPRYTTMHSGIYSAWVQDPLGTTNENSAAADPKTK